MRFPQWSACLHPPEEQVPQRLRRIPIAVAGSADDRRERVEHDRLEDHAGHPGALALDARCVFRGRDEFPPKPRARRPRGKLRIMAVPSVEDANELSQLLAKYAVGMTK